MDTLSALIAVFKKIESIKIEDKKAIDKILSLDRIKTDENTKREILNIIEKESSLNQLKDFTESTIFHELRLSLYKLTTIADEIGWDSIEQHIEVSKDYINAMRPDKKTTRKTAKKTTRKKTTDTEFRIN